MRIMKEDIICSVLPRIVNTAARRSQMPWYTIIVIYVTHLMLPRVSVYKKWHTESRSAVFSCLFTCQAKLAMESLLCLLEYYLLQPSKAMKDSGYDKSGFSESSIDRLCTQ